MTIAGIKIKAWHAWALATVIDAAFCVYLYVTDKKSSDA